MNKNLSEYFYYTLLIHFASVSGTIECDTPSYLSYTLGFAANKQTFALYTETKP